MNKNQNKVAIVTGAGHPQGIGRAIASKLAESGSHVAVTDLEGAAGLNSVADELSGLGPEAIAIACDVTKPDQVAAAFTQVADRFGRIDILVNNAGVGVGSADFLELEERDWDITLAVNVKGVANCCRQAIPLMLKQGEGLIINIASLAGLGAIDSIPANYTASKHAVTGLTKQLAVQYAKQGIRCNAVCPGSIVTQMHQQTLELIAAENGITIEEAQQLEDAHIPLGYSAQPSAIADAVAYLASPAASYITGVALPVAGGMAPGL